VAKQPSPNTPIRQDNLTNVAQGFTGVLNQSQLNQNINDRFAALKRSRGL